MAGRNGYEKTNWISDRNVIALAHDLMGGIDLDPASSAEANGAVRATEFHDEESNGFFRIAAPRVFVNPPGGSINVSTGLCIPKPPRASDGVKLRRVLPKGTRIGNAPAAWWHQTARAHRERSVDQALFFGFNIEIMQLAQGRTRTAMRSVHGDHYSGSPADYVLFFPAARCKFQVPSDDFGYAEVAGGVNASVVVWLPPPRLSLAEVYSLAHGVAYVRTGKAAVVVPTGATWREAR
jgi:hypothetical protein